MPQPPHDPRQARAEERLDMLRELAELGMTLARELTRRAVYTPEPLVDPDPPAAAAAAAAAAARGDTGADFAARPHREPRHDPAESFARVSRAVRLTLALEARAEADLAALLAGTVSAPAADGPSSVAPDAPKPVKYEDPPLDHGSPHRNQIRDRVFEAINAEITDIYPAQEALSALYERLAESDRYDAFIHRPVKESVAAICEDLGLHPDWSRWTDEGFTPKPDGPKYQWQLFWGPWPRRGPAPRRE
jgi:hypothetical protein